MPLFVPKDRKSLFRQFLAGMYDAVVITDPEGHILEVNPRTAEHFGYAPDEMLDKPVSTLIPGLTSEIVTRIRRGLADDRHVMVDASGVSRSGERFACEVTISPIELSDPDDLVFTIRNVERRRRIRETLRAKENCFELSPSALFACESGGRFTETNAAFRAMFDLEDECAARARTFAELMEDRPLVDGFRRALVGESVTVRLEAEADETDLAEMEVVLAPNRIGRKIRGVVGSVTRV